MPLRALKPERDTDQDATTEGAEVVDRPAMEGSLPGSVRADGPIPVPSKLVVVGPLAHASRPEHDQLAGGGQERKVQIGMRIKIQKSKDRQAIQG